MPNGGHNHRVAVFRGPKYPELPFSALDSRKPEDLWRYADVNRAQGIDLALIPHNSNLSNGQQFAMTGPDGAPMSREYAETKARNEWLVEVTQVKGSSETHPILSPGDGFAAFETHGALRRRPEGEAGRQLRAPGAGARAGDPGAHGRESLPLRPGRVDRLPFGHDCNGGGQLHRCAGRFGFPVRRQRCERAHIDQCADAPAGGSHLCRRPHRRMGRAEHARGPLRGAATARGLRYHRAAHAGAAVRGVSAACWPDSPARLDHAGLRTRRADGRDAVGDDRWPGHRESSCRRRRSPTARTSIASRS